MATFRCTQGLLDHLGIKATEAAPGTSGDTTLGDWYAKIFMVDRRKVVLWTNEQTLLSFVMLKVRTKKPEHFYMGFLHGLTMALQLEQIPLADVERIVREYEGEMAITKTTNRSLVASMNQIGQVFDHMVWYNHGFKHCDIGDIVHKLNNTPWKAIGFKFPSGLVRERCASSRCH